MIRHEKPFCNALSQKSLKTQQKKHFDSLFLKVSKTEIWSMLPDKNKKARSTLMLISIFM